MIAGISRVRNESLILEDTLNHFLKYCDRIFIYDDCSTDNSVEIMESFDKVSVIRGEEWSPNQWKEESKHRAKLLEKAINFDMCLCFDSDERLEGELPEGLGGFTFDLYDGYLTKEFCEAYTSGKLSELARLYGPERREIMFYFEPRKASFHGNGKREPVYSGERIKSSVKVKHFGKCLSAEHWEETCDFYSKYFPQWRKKWEERKGKAIHNKSDFGADLFSWEELCLKF